MCSYCSSLENADYIPNSSAAMVGSPRPPPQKLVDQVLEAVYGDETLSLDAANEVDVSDARRVNAAAGGNKAINYGETTTGSWAQVLRAIEGSTAPKATSSLPSAPSGAAEAPATSSGEQLLEEISTPASHASGGAPQPPIPPVRCHLPFGAGDCFLDLGSGRGCLVVQAALMCPGMRCVGIELSRKRHAIATASLKRLEQLAARPKAPKAVISAARTTSFRCEDMRVTCGCPLVNSTVPVAQKENEIKNTSTSLNDSSSLISDATLVYLMNQDLPAKLQEDIVASVLSEAARRNNLPSEALDAAEAPKSVPTLNSERESAQTTSASHSTLEDLVEKATLEASSLESGGSRIEGSDEADATSLPAPSEPQAETVFTSSNGSASVVRSNEKPRGAIPSEVRRRLVLLTLLRPRVNQNGGHSLPEPEVLSCRQSWDQAGARDVDLFVYDLVAA